MSGQPPSPSPRRPGLRGSRTAGPPSSNLSRKLATALSAASLAASLGACGGKERDACAVHCSSEGLCPEGFICQAGWCTTAGTTCAADGDFPDGPPVADAPNPPDAPADAVPDAPPCVGGDIALEDPMTGHCYLVFTSNRNWVAARDNCAALSMHLATLSSIDENILIRSNNGIYRWIGLNDGDREGTFVWVNAEPFTFTNWNGGEPNNNNDEDCVGMLGDGRWNDFDCGDSYDSVCERP